MRYVIVVIVLAVVISRFYTSHKSEYQKMMDEIAAANSVLQHSVGEDIPAIIRL